MIKYNSGSFGFALLFRLHGSAVFKSLTPSIFSSVLFVILYNTTDLVDDDDPIFDHPYALGALVAAFTFMLSFRANFSYNRYWEAFTVVHQMHSKWLDVGMDIASFHLQSTKYDGRRPPAFGDHPDLTCLERERERLNEPTLDDVEDRIDDIMAQHEQVNTDQSGKPKRRRFRNLLSSSPRKSIRRGGGNQKPKDEEEPRHSRIVGSNDIQQIVDVDSDEPSHVTRKATHLKSINATNPSSSVGHQTNSILKNSTSSDASARSGGWSNWRFFKPTKPRQQLSEADLAHVDPSQPVLIKTMSSGHLPRAWEENQPPLLLQEGAHLLSLLSAVALSTLRNDLEEADSPLISFTPNAPWPHVDPDAYGADVRRGWDQSRPVRTMLSFLLGMSRTPAARTLYNAARPFRVIGGVSDAEIEVLQAARGPYAKVALCTMWVEEFITREHLNGGMGAVGAPIISRLFQFTSDGMIGYNQARKIAYIPFPFPHAQITSLFVLVVVMLMPLLMLTYVRNEVLGFFINLVTVMCFTGLHEVARELENPFQNVPNDIPLNNFQAQFNEGLMQMFAGYHPDAFWEVLPAEEGLHDPASSFPPTKQRLESMRELEGRTADPIIQQIPAAAEKLPAPAPAFMDGKEGKEDS